MSRVARIGAVLGASALGLAALTACTSSTDTVENEDNSIVQNETDTPNEIDVE